MNVVWLCHFSNQEIRNILKPRKKIGEIAPWITALANLFEGEEDIELHIVSPHEYIRSYQRFTLKGIHYHFFNAHIPLWGRHWPGFFKFDDWTNFFFNKIKVRKIIKMIEPDIVHLHGAENAYYSSSIFQFNKKYPVLVTIQGFISNTSEKENYYIQKRIKIEKLILNTVKHFGYRTRTMGNDIKKHNPYAVLHWHNYPCAEIKYYDTKKKFDVVFFARITKDKGIEDLLKALAIIKTDKPDVSLCVIGGANESYISYLKELTFELKINENIYWAGFLPTQTDVHQLASAARICVLPTYHDIISGTIVESLFLKLPVVAYNVGSIHEVNEKEEIIVLVEKGNINGLADAVIELLHNTGLLKERTEKGYKWITESLNNKAAFSDLIKAYKEVMDDFKRK